MQYDSFNPLKGIPQEQIDAFEKAQEFAFAVLGGESNDSNYWSSRITERASIRSSNWKSASNPHTCKYCQVLVIDPGQPEDPWYAINTNSCLKKVVFDCSVDEIEDGYSNGCPLMTQLWTETKMPTKEEQCEDTYRIVADIAMRGSMDSGEFTSLSSLRLLNIDYPWKTPHKELDGCEGTLKLADCDFDVYAEPEDPGACIIRNRPIRENPAGDMFLQDVKRHLERSIDIQQALQHGLTYLTAMPTRLIRIAKVNGCWSMRLEDVKDTTVQYCTLSYCWGLEPAGLTTRANVRQRYDSLNFEELPKTIQDAVIIVEKLGFEYLWVDAICIIQESDDKAQEITKMAGIYENSVLMICASRALAAEEGFLHPRIHFEPGSQSFKLPFILPGNQGMGSVIIGRPMESIGENRLQSRAWAFQERIMARRILDFDDEATSIRWWEPDGELHIQDGGSLDHARDWSSTDSVRARDFYLQYDFSSIENINDVDFMCDWIGRVNVYTSLDVTLTTDRILAISSVAQKAAKLTNGTYLAGLWLKHLPWILMWSISDRRVRPTRPVLYQGPSWSWVGINGGVHGYYPQRLRKEGAKVECKIIGYEVDPVYVNAPYGSLKSATLVIQARARRARWVRSDKVKAGGDYDYMAYHPQDRPVWHSSHSQNKDDTKKVLRSFELPKNQTYTSEDLLPLKMYPDALEHEFKTPIEEGGHAHLDVILLQLFRHEGDVLGLVIREPEEGVCQRLGIFTTRKGQNHYYATDEADHEVVKAEDSKTNEDNDEEVFDFHIASDLTTKVQQLGSAWEKQIKKETEEQHQRQREEADWKHFFSWFDKDDCQEQVFVLV